MSRLRKGVGLVLALLVMLWCSTVLALAAETTKSLEPGKTLEFTNKKATEAEIQTNAEEIGATFDMVVYPTKGDGDLRQEVAISSSSLQVPQKGRLVLTVSPQSQGPLVLTFDGQQLALKEASKPVLERRTIESGNALEFTGTGTDRTVLVSAAEGAEPVYDMVVYSDRTTMAGQVPAANAAQLTVPAKGRVAISVQEGGAPPVEVVFDPQGVKVSVPADLALKRRVLEQGKSCELRSSGSDRTVLVKAEGSLRYDYVVYQGKGKVLQQARGVADPELLIPSKTTAIVTVPLGAESPVEVTFEPATLKFLESSRPAFEYQTLQPGESAEIACGGPDGAIYVGTDGISVPYDLSIYTDKGKVNQQEEGCTATELAVPTRGRAVLSLSSGAEGTLELAFDPSVLKFGRANRPALGRKDLAVGQSCQFTNQTTDDMRVSFRPASDGGAILYDAVAYSAKGDIAQLITSSSSSEIWVPSRGKAVVSVVGQDSNAQLVFDPQALSCSDSDHPALEHKSVQAGQSVELKNLRHAPFELTLDSGGGSEAIVDCVVYGSKGAIVDEYIGASRSSLQLPDEGRMVLSVPAEPPKDVQITFDPRIISFATSPNPAMVRQTIVPGQGIELTNSGTADVTLYTDSDEGAERLVDYVIVGSDGFPVRQGLSTAVGQMRLQARMSAYLSVPDGQTVPVIVSYLPGTAVFQPLTEPALKRRSVRPGETVEYRNNSQRRVDLTVFSDRSGAGDITFCVTRADSSATGASVEAMIRTTASISVDPGSSLGISVPMASSDSIRVAAYEAALEVKPEAAAVLPIYPSGTITFTGSLKASAKLKSFSVAVSGGSDPSFSQIVVTASVPQATDIALSRVSYQPKGPYLLSAGDYTLTIRGDKADGTGELDVARFGVRVLSAFDSMEAEYLPELDKVRVKAVTKAGLVNAQTQAFRQMGIQMPIWVGVQDTESSMPAMALMKDEFRLTAVGVEVEGRPQSYEALIGADTFPRGHALNLWPVAFGFSSMQEAPQVGSVPLHLTTTPRSAWSVRRNWTSDMLEATLQPKVAKDEYSFFGTAKASAPAAYYVAVFGVGQDKTLVPVTGLGKPTLSLSSTEGSSMGGAWSVSDINLPLGIGGFTELACTVVTAGSEAESLDAQGMPRYAALIETVPIPPPAIDGPSISLSVDALTGTAEVSGTLRGVPGTYSVALLVSDGSELPLWASRDNDYAVESSIRFAAPLSQLGAGTGAQAFVALIVRDPKGTEVCRSEPIPVPLDVLAPPAPGPNTQAPTK